MLAAATYASRPQARNSGPTTFSMQTSFPTNSNQANLLNCSESSDTLFNGRLFILLVLRVRYFSNGLVTCAFSVYASVPTPDYGLVFDFR